MVVFIEVDCSYQHTLLHEGGRGAGLRDRVRIRMELEQDSSLGQGNRLRREEEGADDVDLWNNEGARGDCEADQSQLGRVMLVLSGSKA
jgi:hypothetical protein